MTQTCQTPSSAVRDRRADRDSADPRMWLAGELLCCPALQLDTALFCTASVADTVDVQGVLDVLDKASLEMFDTTGEGCAAQSLRLAQTLTNTLSLVAEHDHVDSLFVDRALLGRRAHPLLVASIGSEIARRAGLHSHVCQSSNGWWTALVAGNTFALVGTNPVERPMRGTLRRLCAHQIARTVLELIYAKSAEPHARRAAHLAQKLHGCAA